MEKLNNFTRVSYLFRMIRKEDEKILRSNKKIKTRKDGGGGKIDCKRVKKKKRKAAHKTRKKIKKKEKIRKEEGQGNKDCKREEDKNYKKREEERR